MKKGILLFSILILGAQIAITSPGPEEAPAVQILEHSTQGIQYSIDFPEISLTDEILDGAQYTKVTMDGAGSIAEEGAPDLPVWSETIAIPNGATVSVQVLNQQTQIQSLDRPVIPYRPVMDNPETVISLERNAAIYNEESTYPASLVQVSDPMVMRDLTLVTVSVNPVIFHSQASEIEVTDNITIDVQFSGGTLPGSTHPISEAFFPIYQNYVMNWQDFMSEENVQRGTLMIVTPSSLESYLEPLVRWKMMQGYTVHVATTSETGTSTSSIKNYIDDYYTNTDPMLEYVLLIGDESGSYSIPSYTYNNDVGDRKYGELVGSDYLPELIVGRYSISSPLELNSLINKQIRYEKNPYDLASGWLTRALNVASYAHAYSVLEIMRNVSHLFEEKQFTQVDSAYYPATGDAAAATIITNAINNGAAFVNYRGWAGSSGWYEPDYHTDDLQSTNIHNGYYNGIMTSIVCGTGNFGTTECFGEAWIREGTPTNPKGGVAFYGSTEFNQNVRYANIIDASFYYGAIRKRIRGFGSAYLYSKMAVWEGFPNNRNDGSNYGVEFYFHIYNILGDPSLQMWVGNPRSVVADFPTNISTVAPTIPVHVVTTLFSNNVRNAHVTLMPEDNEDIYKSSVTDQYGRTYIDVSDVPPGEYVLTVTGNDMIPISQTVTISEQPVALSMEDWGLSEMQIEVDNQLWEPGETFNLAPEVKNMGSLGSDTVSASLQVIHPDFTLETDEVQYAPVDSGSTAAPLTPFQFSVDEVVRDFNPAKLILTLSSTDTADNEYTWNYSRDFDRGIPAFELESITYDTQEDYWQPAEIIDVQIELSNLGPIAAQNVTGWVTSSHSNISFPENEGIWGTIDVSGTATNPQASLRIQASPNTIPGTVANFALHVGPEGGTAQEIPFNLSIGEVESTDPIGPDEHGYHIFDNTDTHYSKAPEYNWIEIAPSQGGPGEEVPLNDTGENNDDNYDIDLPFPFKFYGVWYDMTTINSNGYLGLGGSRWFSQRNWPIPGPLGAEGAMIAGYWDDLYLRSGSEVATWYDEDNGRFIIEYSEMGNVIGSSGDIETFQIILYDPAEHPTPTGDGEIVVQYHTINEVPGSGGRDNASTVGIMNEAHNVGIQYLYAQHYPPGGASIGTGRAIKFTTDPGTATGPPDLAELPFDDLFVVVGDTSEMTQSFTLENIGGETLSFSASISYDSTSNWLAVTPESSTLPPNGTVEMTLSIDSTGLTNNATYGAALEISSNSINYSNLTIPILLYFNTAMVPGDLNLDGVADSSDVAMIQDHIMHGTELPQLQFILADFDEDNVLTIKDIMHLLQAMETE